MSGGLLIQPSYAQDLDYPAYQDRLLMKSMGVQAGVVGGNDFKVTAGSGLQVEVEKGSGFVEQTGATQESSNTFYNGLYNILNPTKQNPSNSVEVPTTNPQIAQIILRVYDKEELGLTGNSYASIEWLNGTANAGATKAHVEAGEASSYGAAALPVSSYLLYYIIVPKNATVSSEYTIINKRSYGSQFPLKMVERTESLVASPGELVFINISGKVVTLPNNLPENSVIGIYSGINTTEIKTSGLMKIYGDFITGKETIILLEGQHVLLQYYKNTDWFIIAGEPKREQVYSAWKEVAKATMEAGVELSAHREAFISIIGQEAPTVLEIGGVNVGDITNAAANSYIVLPGQKVRTTVSCHYSVLLR